MPKFAANLTMLFTEAPFMERFALARKSGFKYVEYLFPYPHALEDLKAQLKTHGLQQVLLSLPLGNWAAGDRGIAAHPARVDEFRAGVSQAIQYAQGFVGLEYVPQPDSASFFGWIKEFGYRL